MNNDQEMIEEIQPTYALTKVQRFGWYCFFLVISVWMFFCGVLVGRHTSPIEFNMEKIHGELAFFIQKLKIMRSEQHLVELQPIDSSGLSFYDKLKNTPAENTAEPVTTVTPTPPTKKEEAVSPLKKALTDPIIPTEPQNSPEIGTIENQQTTSNSPPVGTTPSEQQLTSTSTKPDENLPKASELKPESTGNYVIQIASLKDIKDAEEMVQKLKLKGYAPYIRSALIKDKGTWYRVRIGSYGKSDEAAKILQQLKQERINGLIIHLK
ncbi:MAG: SPOR domain-containing protein [Desulfobacterales bacterium]|nr:SPOR domain-containing protein [Desulfobacterales bacterium]